VRVNDLVEGEIDESKTRVKQEGVCQTLISRGRTERFLSNSDFNDKRKACLKK